MAAITNNNFVACLVVILIIISSLLSAACQAEGQLNLDNVRQNLPGLFNRLSHFSKSHESRAQSVNSLNACSKPKAF